MFEQCPICKTSVPKFAYGSSSAPLVQCNVCGDFHFSELAFRELNSVPFALHIVSAAIREQYEQGIVLRVDNLRHLVDSVVVPKTPLESIDRILSYVLRKSTSAELGVPLSKETDYPIAYAKNPAEFGFFLQIAAGNAQYLEAYPDGSHFRLMMNGWERLADLPPHEVRSDQAFVAMWFDPSLEEIWENGFKPALIHVGYNPLRIDRVEHNGKIDDRIVAEIRKSGLLVADVTGQRNGVYFEAGLAMGLGLPVIWSCHKLEIDKLHFDTRQYSHVVWTNADDLREKLINRIEGTLLNRPIKKRAATYI